MTRCCSLPDTLTSTAAAAGSERCCTKRCSSSNSRGRCHRSEVGGPCVRRGHICSEETGGLCVFKSRGTTAMTSMEVSWLCTPEDGGWRWLTASSFCCSRR